MRVFNFTATGMGGFAFDGLDAALELYGVPEADTELLLHGLDVIKRHRPQQSQTPAQH